MIWNMGIDEVEAFLRKIWELHDKLSDAIHSISRAHFLSIIKKKQQQQRSAAGEEKPTSGYVFVKEFGVGDDAIREAKSLNSIRTALENLEDQLEFFQTVQIQQRAERDSAIARLEQSRMILAMRLADHHGNKYKVIDEALAFVGDVQDASCFIPSNNNLGSPDGPSKNSGIHWGERLNVLIKFLISRFNGAKNSLRLDHVGVGGILGNAALVTAIMMALLNFNQAPDKERAEQIQGDTYKMHGLTKSSRLSKGSSSHLDVLSARG